MTLKTFCDYNFLNKYVVSHLINNGTSEVIKIKKSSPKMFIFYANIFYYTLHKVDINYL